MSSKGIHDKGIILRSALSSNVKVVLALFDKDDGGTTLMVKPLVTRKDRQGGYVTNLPFIYLVSERSYMHTDIRVLMSFTCRSKRGHFEV